MTAVHDRWRGVIAGPIAFVGHEALCYFVAAQACQNSNRTLGPLTPGGARIVVAVITIVAVSFAIWGALSGWNAWHTSHAELAEAEGYTRPDFVALASATVGGLLAIGILYGGLPLIFVNVCERMR